MKSRSLAALAAILALSTVASPIRAADACLVGKWQPVGDAAAEWMRRNAPGIDVAAADRQGMLELRADGSYVAGGSADATASSNGMRASTRNARFQSQGTWTAARGTLTLRPSRESMRGTMKIQGPDGRAIEMPMPKGPAQAQGMQYACRDGELETRTPIPSATPIVQRYKRVR